MIAALKGKRNCLCLEDNPLLFINSKINVVPSLSMQETQEGARRNGERPRGHHLLNRHLHFNVSFHDHNIFCIITKLHLMIIIF